MKRVLLALCLLAGCQQDDLCGDATVPTCVTIHLTGSTDAPFDRLQVDSTYIDNGTTVVHRQTIYPSVDAGTTVSLPVEFSIVYTNPYARIDSSSANVVILALDHTTAVGLGNQDFPSSYSKPIKPGDHGQVTVTLRAATKDTDCFLNSPPICGTDKCPACSNSQRCGNSPNGYSCADSHCDYPSGSSTERCLP